jgi:hypothetical protein
VSGSERSVVGVKWRQADSSQSVARSEASTSDAVRLSVPAHFSRNATREATATSVCYGEVAPQIRSRQRFCAKRRFSGVVWFEESDSPERCQM